MHQLIYKSVLHPKSNRATITSIVEKAQCYNATKEITGIMLVLNNQILQVLEGKYSHINELFTKIQNDTRHTKIQLLKFDPIKQRYFGEWQMQAVTFDDLSSGIQETLHLLIPTSNDQQEFPDDDNKAGALLTLIAAVTSNSRSKTSN